MIVGIDPAVFKRVVCIGAENPPLSHGMLMLSLCEFDTTIEAGLRSRTNQTMNPTNKIDGVFSCLPLQYIFEFEQTLSNTFS